MSQKLCLIFDAAPRYREEIYQRIEEAYDCDWYIGHIPISIKEMNLSLLSRVQRYDLKGNYNRLYWQCGLISRLFDTRYNTYLTSAETRAFSKWVFLFLASIFTPSKRIYVWSHGYYGKESKLELWIKKWIYSHVSGTFVYGEYARKLMIRHGHDGSKIFPIHNSLHYTVQKKIRNSITPSSIFVSHFHNNNPVLCFIGRLTEVKRLDLLIEAVALLRKNGYIYNIVFVGDGETRNSLEMQVRDLGLSDNVWFYGECFNEEENANILYNSDLCIAPGNVGLTAIHSMMFGCPVISHNNLCMQMPEFEAIVPGRTGDFFKEADVESLADVIQQWFNQHGADRNKVRETCFEEIDSKWNPDYQIDLIRRVIQDH